jgi:Rho termination factor-like protein
MSKNCKDYKVVELRKMASKKGITGYSKMRKDELCMALELSTKLSPKKK